MFLNPNDSRILIILIYLIYETSRNKLKKHSVTKNCSDLSLFEEIVLVISKISSFSLQFQKFFWSLEHFLITIGQNNCVNKIQFLKFSYGQLRPWTTSETAMSSANPEAINKAIGEAAGTSWTFCVICDPERLFCVVRIRTNPSRPHSA